MIKPDLVKWDTTFFGYAVGQCSVNCTQRNRKCDMDFDPCIKKFRLIYLYNKTVNAQISTKIKNFELNYVGDKINLVHNTQRTQQPSGRKDGGRGLNPVSACDQDKPALLELALLSGQYSRYRIDKNFKNSEYERLYVQWMNNSIKNMHKIPVLVVKDENRIAGFVSMSRKEKRTIKIDLIAVEEKYRGRGIASRLLEAVFVYAEQHGSDVIEVTTQSSNVPALHLYQKSNFVIQSQFSIYHLWNSNEKNRF